jgi:short-chain fatty acids transporter
MEPGAGRVEITRNRTRKKRMIRSMGEFFSRVARRFLPDAFVFALILVLLTLVLGMLVEGASFLEMATYFGEGVWDFLVFSMQMVLILVTGSALATSKPVHLLLRSIAGRTKSPGAAIVLTTLTMMVGCWINWGFGLIVSALLARELARNIRDIHYPLLVASAYSGFIVWHAGLSASIPLKIAGQDTIMERFAGGATIPASQTIFAWQNLLLVAALLAIVPLVNRLMTPRKREEIITVDASVIDEGEAGEEEEQENAGTPAERLERSRLLSIAIGLLGTIFIVRFFTGGGRIGFNILNFVFLTAGIILHGTPIRYVRAINDAARTCGGIILQFPFYAGIMGMMIHSGLAVTLSQAFVDISSERTFPLFTYLSAGLVNFFVPSGGGQWAVQGPIMIPAAGELGVSYATTAMAIAWGDAWTNLVQPFWALPLLAVARLGIRDIMGYTTVVLLFSGVVTALFMLFVF